MDFDGNDVDKRISSERDDDQPSNLLNLSSTSGDTIILEGLNMKKLEKRPIEYFTQTNNNEKVKCSICLHVSKPF